VGKAMPDSGHVRRDPTEQLIVLERRLAVMKEDVEKLKWKITGMGHKVVQQQKIVSTERSEDEDTLDAAVQEWEQKREKLVADLENVIEQQDIIIRILKVKTL
jgi:predicted  nucleic acid-binding Zn-ribbon protein